MLKTISNFREELEKSLEVLPTLGNLFIKEYRVLSALGSL